ncbi:MAG TPA: ankyrin repeat domain-containing protein [Vicinamibacterales bacterium]|jgi:ankyrin repeat protein|nr:ankyrin repeat domain-containing protein [Vicinamibacterales bacterium]
MRYTSRIALVALLSVASLSAGRSESPLSEAIQAGNREEIQKLLKDPAAVKAAEADGTTPLHWAVRADDVETSKALLKAGANASAANRYGVTPLSLAAVNGNVALIEALLSAGASANSIVSKGQTVLMTAARTGNPAAVRVLIEGGADVNARESQLGETALMWAASENHAEVVTLLASRGADVNARSSTIQFPKDRFGLEGVLTILPHGNWSPLMYAARDGGVDAARALAKAGADINATDPDGTTALIFAIMNAHYDTANAILEAGADPNIVDKAGMAALYAAVDMSSLGEVYGMPPRKVNDTLKPADLISRLIAKGAVVDARLTSATLQRNHTPGEGQLGAGTTPLMRAARNGDYAAMKILLAAGADPTLKQPRGTTALMMASGLGRGLGVFAKDYGTEADLRQAVELLVERNVDVNASTDDGITAIHLAAQGGLDSIITVLAKAGARLDVKDKRGRTPVDMAMGVGGRGRAGGPPPVYERTAKLLKELGAP